MEPLSLLKKPLSKNEIEEIAAAFVKQPDKISALMNLTFHQEEQVGFRAAWVLETVFIADAKGFVRLLPKFIGIYHQQQNLSARRHFSKIMALATSKKAIAEIRDAMLQSDLEQVVSTSFDWLVSDTPVAIKSHCLNILANLVPRYPWVRMELTETMDYLVDKESIAFFAKVKQIRRQLGRIANNAL